MSSTLIIRDDVIGGKAVEACELHFDADIVAVRDVIRERVYQEAQDRVYRRGRGFRKLVEPVAAERTLNDRGAHPPVDWHHQFALACDAFNQRRFIVLVGDRQVMSLDEELLLVRDTEVTFLRLVPLVGG